MREMGFAERFDGWCHGGMMVVSCAQIRTPCQMLLLGGGYIGASLAKGVDICVAHVWNGDG